MTRYRNFVVQAPAVALVSLLALGLTGCPFKKKKPPVPQPSAQAPTVTEPTPTPSPTATPAPTPEPPEPEKTEPTAKPKAKSKPAPKRTEPAPAAAQKPEEKPQQQATARPPRIVIQEGSTAANQGDITTAIAHDEATHRRLTTAQLLQSTEDNLRGLKRILSAEDQATVAQIKDYMEQARQATAQEDTVRAHNLALKAHLLSDELAKK